MSTFHVTIHTNSAAFDPPQDEPSAANRVYARRLETARILRTIADTIEHHPLDGHGDARDMNGNKVASWHAAGEADTDPEED